MSDQPEEGLSALLHESRRFDPPAGLRERANAQPGIYEEAAAEFAAVIERAPTNDFALFCLGRSLQLLGRHAEARKPLALAACLQPDRRDYRLYRDRARAAAARS